MKTVSNRRFGNSKSRADPAKPQSKRLKKILFTKNSITLKKTILWPKL